MENMEYQIGLLTSSVENLTQVTNELKQELRQLRDAVDGIRLWKSQILGASLVVTIIASTIFQATLLLWPK